MTAHILYYSVSMVHVCMRVCTYCIMSFLTSFACAFILCWIGYMCLRAFFISVGVVPRLYGS